MWEWSKKDGVSSFQLLGGDVCELQQLKSLPAKYVGQDPPPQRNVELVSMSQLLLQLATEKAGWHLADESRSPKDRRIGKTWCRHGDPVAVTSLDAALMGQDLGTPPVSAEYVCTHSILKLPHSLDISIPLRRCTQTISVGRIHSLRNGIRPVFYQTLWQKAVF